jgi:hypothetical protein
MLIVAFFTVTLGVVMLSVVLLSVILISVVLFNVVLFSGRGAYFTAINWRIKLAPSPYEELVSFSTENEYNV